MSGLKLKYVPQFPGQVIGGAGITIDDNLVVSTDYAQFPLISPYAPQATHYALVYNQASGSFFLAPATSFMR